MLLPRGLRVLVVQDTPDPIGTLAQALGSAGHTVELTANALAALESVRLSRPAVVVLDTCSEQAQEYPSARRIHEASFGRRPFIVALGESEGAQARIQARTAGIDLYLSRPFDMNTLLLLLGRFQTIIDDMEGFDPVI